MIPENKKLEQQIETLLGEVKELKENQKIMTNKIEKMQQVIDHIESDIYSDEGFDFEIVCPYCENEFVIDANEDKNEVECPECKNVIELDWTGDLYDDEDDGCSGHCCGCSGCGDSSDEENEDDDM
jgi:uncharacterized Zn-finger protein